MSWSSQRWNLAWAAAKDVALTGTGMALILSQIWAAAPSAILLATGLALTVPSIAAHARTLLASGEFSPAAALLAVYAAIWALVIWIIIRGR